MLLSDIEAKETQALARMEEEESQLRVARQERTESLLATKSSKMSVARLRLDLDQAVQLSIETVQLTSGISDRFEALRSMQDTWYERGRDKGLAFDLEVSVALARHCHSTPSTRSSVARR